MSHTSGTCSKCGRVTGSKRAKVCAQCYRSRGPEGLPPRVGECGHAISKGAKTCRKCFDTRKLAKEPSPRAPQDYDEAMALWRRIIGCTKREYQGPAKKRQSTTQRIAICGDLHAPFQHTEALAAFIERERGADVCIVAGDLQDHYSISRFVKYEAVPIHQELAAAQMILERLSEAFPTVLVIEGNHDSSRFEKLLRDRLPIEAVEIVQYLSRTGNLSTIEALCGQFSNVEHVKNKVGRYSASWYLQHGDLLVTHAEKFSRVPGSALRSIEDWATDFEGVLGLKPWSVIAQAHTHQQALMPWGADKLLVEIGCLCQTMGYQLTAKVGGRPQRQGWVSLAQTNGVTDLSSVHPYWWRKSA